MKRIILAILLLFNTVSYGAMLDENGKPRIEPFLVREVIQYCDATGFFVVNNTLYMCVKIQTNVSADAVRENIRAYRKFQEQKRKEQDEWYKEWIKTEEGKAWEKEYNRKLKLK